MAPLPYGLGIETIGPDEQATIDGIVAGMTRRSRVVEKREGRATAGPPAAAGAASPNATRRA